MAEITRKSVLLECLSIMREEQRICSKGYNCLEPAKGMEEAWEQGRRKIELLEDIIHALDSEPVLRAMANWQKEIVEKGTPRENNSEFAVQPSAVARDSSTTPAAPVGMTQGDEIRVVKISDEMKEYVESLNGDILDHEDGTMELR